MKDFHYQRKSYRLSEEVLKEMEGKFEIEKKADPNVTWNRIFEKILKIKKHKKLF